MNRHRIALALATLMALLATASRSDADYLLSLETSATQPILSNSSIDVDVFIEQTAGSTGLDDGLISAGIRVAFSSTSASGLVFATGLTPNAAFSDVFDQQINFTPGDSSGEVVLRMNDLLGVLPTGNRILLATITLLSQGPGITVLTASEFDPSASAIDFATPVADLDPVGSGQLTIAVVPEPASLALAALGAGLVACTARFRRRRPRA